VRQDDTFARLEIDAVRSRLLARAGEHEAAKALASETAAVAETTDGLNRRAEVQLALAEVLERAGRADAAAAALARARERLEAKGNVAALALLETSTATSRSNTA
jgi:hypothetical protein